MSTTARNTAFALAAAFLLLLGFYVPAPLQHLLMQGTAMLEVTR